MKLSVFAGALAACALTAWSAPAAAAQITYTLQGTWSGQYATIQDGQPLEGTLATLGPTHVVLTLIGQTPSTDIGDGDVVHLTDASVFVEGMPSLSGDLDAPDDAALVFGKGAYSGDVALGTYDAPDLDAALLFYGDGLLNYHGATNLAATSVRFPEMGDPPAPQTFQLGLGDEGVEFESFGDTTFSAVVPEPASWALMIGGLLAAGAGLRRARQAGAVA